MSEELPRLAGLEGFEVWDRNVHAPENREVKAAFVAVRVGGTVGVNKNCYAMWGEPKACRVMFDPERRRLALRPCEPDEPGAYWLDDQQRDLPLRNLFRYYDVRLVETRRYYDPKVLDGVLVVDL